MRDFKKTFKTAGIPGNRNGGKWHFFFPVKVFLLNFQRLWYQTGRSWNIRHTLPSAAFSPLKKFSSKNWQQPDLKKSLYYLKAKWYFRSQLMCETGYICEKLSSKAIQNGASELIQKGQFMFPCQSSHRCSPSTTSPRRSFFKKEAAIGNICQPFLNQGHSLRCFSTSSRRTNYVFIRKESSVLHLAQAHQPPVEIHEGGKPLPYGPASVRHGQKVVCGWMKSYGGETFGYFFARPENGPQLESWMVGWHDCIKLWSENWVNRKKTRPCWSEKTGSSFCVQSRCGFFGERIFCSGGPKTNAHITSSQNRYCFEIGYIYRYRNTEALSWARSEPLASNLLAWSPIEMAARPLWLVGVHSDWWLDGTRTNFRSVLVMS